MLISFPLNTFVLIEALLVNSSSYFTNAYVKKLSIKALIVVSRYPDAVGHVVDVHFVWNIVWMLCVKYKKNIDVSAGHLRWEVVVCHVGLEVW